MRCSAQQNRRPLVVRTPDLNHGPLWGPLLEKTGRPPLNDGARSLAIIHVAIVQGSTGEPWRGPGGCGLHVGDGNTAPDPVSKSEKARL